MAATTKRTCSHSVGIRRSPAEAAPTLGFSSRLLRRTITKDLAGELDFRFAPGGVCCKIIIPVGTGDRQAA